LKIGPEFRWEEALNTRSDGGIDEKFLAEESVVSYG
jgi:hypothetical protein